MGKQLYPPFIQLTCDIQSIIASKINLDPVIYILDSDSAQDGAEAVKKYSEEKPDMVIMDITMPNMDGLQALKKIREGDPNAKVVMCTAMGQESMVVDAIKSGARDFVVKPFDAQRIVKTVNDILGK